MGLRPVRRRRYDLDIVVTCHPHFTEPTIFPQVRGHYLAKHLARAGLRAEFQQLPLDERRAEVLICSEYQCEMEWFERHLAGPLEQARVGRMYCLTAYPIRRRDHFSYEYCRWFGKRGGVLCHVKDGRLKRHEHWIGLGVDTDVVRPSSLSRDAVLFDFPQSGNRDAAAQFDATALRAFRKRLRGCRLIGTGPADSPLRNCFDEWIAYGTPHPVYVEHAYRGVFAFVVGWVEAMGLAVAEAQVSGAAVVYSAGDLRPWMICQSAGVQYDRDDVASLADALEEARRRDGPVIAAEAADKFDFAKVVERVRAATGV
jgi:hypothetical protein